MSTTDTENHPLVCDDEFSDNVMYIRGHGHTLEEAQRHIDHAMTEVWRLDDRRFVAREARDLADSGEAIGDWTLVYGDYVDVEHLGE